jgi:antitoxin (DNA-binding transcriptional repressor) of toxin-antitoxin stability system
MSDEPEQLIQEVSVRALSSTTSQVLAAVLDGTRIVATKHGNAIAVLLAIDDALEWLIATSEEFDAAVPRRTLLTALWGPGIDSKLKARDIGRLIHGRGWD